MTGEQHILTLDHCTLAYGKTVIASNISATLEAGQLTCLIGRNGAGKTTLIKHIIPLLKRRKEKSENVAVVLTDRLDDCQLTAYEVAAMGRMPYTGHFGTLSNHDHDIVRQCLRKVGLTDRKLLQRTLTRLSDGERQRVMIAKAMAQQTPVIILDEPTAFLDYPSKVEVMQMLQQLAHDDGKAILLTTHDLDIALRHCDKVWHMHHGTMTEQTPQQLLAGGNDICSIFN